MVAQVGEMVVLIMQEIPRWQSVFYNFADTCSGRNGFFSFIGEVLSYERKRLREDHTAAEWKRSLMRSAEGGES